jgi:hypothetical protein
MFSFELKELLAIIEGDKSVITHTGGTTKTGKKKRRRG